MDESTSPVRQFCADLRVRWQASGRDLPSITRDVRISRTQLYAILNGEIERPPDFAAMVRPFLLACAPPMLSSPTGVAATGWSSACTRA